MRSTRLVVPVIVAAGLLLAACGGASSGTSGSGAPAAAAGRPWTDTALGQRLGLEPSDDIGWHDVASGCDALVLLKTPQEVAVYDGDAWLVKSPSGGVAVKVGGGEPTCMTRFRTLLADVPDQQPG